MVVGFSSGIYDIMALTIIFSYGFTLINCDELVHFEKTFPAIPNMPLVLCVRVEIS